MTIDFHTHLSNGTGIVALTPDQMTAMESLHTPIMVGIHPWDTADETAVNRQLEMLPRLLADNRVVALGEIGIDTLRGASVERQSELMALQIALAEQYSLPVVIHSVRSLNRIINLHDRLKPTTPWAIHGITGKQGSINKLAERGIYMSVGWRTPINIIPSIPDHLLLAETDNTDSGNDTSIDSIVERIANSRHTTSATITTLLSHNLTHFFTHP